MNTPSQQFSRLFAFLLASFSVMVAFDDIKYAVMTYFILLSISRIAQMFIREDE